MAYIYTIISILMIVSLVQSGRHSRKMSTVNVIHKMDATFKSQMIYYFLFVLIVMIVVQSFGRLLTEGTLGIDNIMMVVMFIIMGYSQFYSMPRYFYIYEDGIGITGYMPMISRSIYWRDIQGAQLDSKDVLKIKVDSKRAKVTLRCKIDPNNTALLNDLEKRFKIDKV